MHRPFHFRIKECFGGKYNIDLFKGDAISGLTVSVVALPLSIALAVASGASPSVGVITAVVAGLLISLFSGSRVQIGGPTGAFVVIVHSIIVHHGYDGLLLATFLAGFFLIGAAFLNLGKIIKYISPAVVTGFTSGIALIIIASQIGDILGLHYKQIPHVMLDKLHYYLFSIPKADLNSVLLFSVLLAFNFLIRRLFPKLPVFLIIVILACFANALLDLNLETLHNRFGDISLNFANHALPIFNVEKVIHILPSALIIALLAGVESLLSAMVADSMSGDRHHSNTELFGQGLANIASSLFGGLPATGAIARTAANIKSGGKTPLSGIFHAIFIFLAAYLFVDYISLIPFVALAVILVAVAFGMSEYKEFIFLFGASSDDRLILLATFLLTVFVDLVVGISCGIIISSLLFVHRMSNITFLSGDSRYLVEHHEELPENVFMITFNGPLFFGTAYRISNAFDLLSSEKETIIINLERVPFIDSSAAKKLKEFIDRFHHKANIILCVEQSDIRHSLKKFKVKDNLKPHHIVSSTKEAIKLSGQL